MKKIVGLAGVFQSESRTVSLVRELCDNASVRGGFSSAVITLADFGQSLPLAQRREDLDDKAGALLAEIMGADALIVGVPTWNAGYPGMFKHLLDLMPPGSVAGKPTLLSATGGSERHALMPEYQLRPLFSYLKASIVPTVLFATPNDFNGLNHSAAFQNRAGRAINELISLTGSVSCAQD